jgi:hypothetical protein
LAAGAPDPYTPGKEERYGRQDTKASAETEEAEDADGRHPLITALDRVENGRAVIRWGRPRPGSTGVARAPVAFVLPAREAAAPGA